jgi:hypothetical protein
LKSRSFLKRLLPTVIGLLEKPSFLAYSSFFESPTLIAKDVRRSFFEAG